MKRFLILSLVFAVVAFAADKTKDGDVMLKSAPSPKGETEAVPESGSFSVGTKGSTEIIRDIFTGSDLDGDGLKEVILASYGTSGRAYVYEIDMDNNASLLFDTGEMGSDYTSAVRDARFGDLDGNGVQELLVSVNSTLTAKRGIWAFEWDATGDSMRAPVQLFGDIGDRWYVENFNVGDVDGDGVQELFVGNNASASALDNFYIFSVESGTFAAGNVVTKTEFTHGKSATTFTVGGSPYGGVMADMDGDGNKEVIFAPWDNGAMLIVEADAADTYTVHNYIETDLDIRDDFAFYDFFPADLNGDGRDEIYLSMYDGGRLYEITCPVGSNLGDLTTANVISLDALGSSGGVCTQIGDWDYNGKMEIIASGGGSWLSVHEFQGGDVTDPNNWTKMSNLTNANFSGVFGMRYAGDLDGDGYPEIYAANTGATTVAAVAIEHAPEVVINEFDTNTSTAEYIELYNMTDVAIDLASDGYILVFVNGNGDAIYQATALTGSLPANGYFVIAEAGVTDISGYTPDQNATWTSFQNGADGVALIKGGDVADFTNILYSTAYPAQSGVQIDAVVYGGVDAELNTAFGTTDIDLAVGSTGSTSRITDGQGGGAPGYAGTDWGITLRTPGSTNEVSKILTAYPVSGTEIMVKYTKDMSSVDLTDYTLNGTSGVSFTGAVIDGTDASLVKLTAAAEILYDLTVDTLIDASVVDTAVMYAGITPIGWTSTTNTPGHIEDGIVALFNGIISANDAFNNVWIADAEGGEHTGVMIYSSSFDALVSVGDAVRINAERATYKNLTELVNPVLLEVVSSGNAPFGPFDITAADIDTSLAADTDPGEKWEGQLVTIDSAMIVSGSGSMYLASTDDGAFYIGDNVAYQLSGITLNIGDSYTITGVVDYDGDTYRLNPRDAADVEYIFMAPDPIDLYSWWEHSTGDLSFFANDNNTRGLGLSPDGSKVYVPSRTGASNIFILNAETGDSLGKLDMTGVSGGTFAINDVDVDADGVIYAANLVTGSTGFKIYRWADDAAVPTIAFSGDVTARAGDSFAVDGSGAATVLYAGGSGNNNIEVFSTTDGLSFVSGTDITLASDYARGGIAPVADGLWVNEGGSAVMKVSFSGTTLATLSTGIVSSSYSAIDYIEMSSGEKLIAVAGGNTVPGTSEYAKIWEVSDASNPWLYASGLLTNTWNTNGNATGGILMYEDPLGALNAVHMVTNNGIAAYSVNSEPVVGLPPVADAGGDQTVLPGAEVFLDGSMSVSQDDGTLSYLWYQTAGPAVTLAGDQAAMATFTAPNVTEDDTLSFALKVTDTNGLMDTAFADVRIIVFDVMDIADVRALPDASMAGVAGVATVNEIGNPWYMQDETAAIAIYDYTSLQEVMVGDSVLLYGEVDIYNGLVELKNLEYFEILSSGNATPAPVLVTPDSLADNETYESQLVMLTNVNYVSGTWPAEGSSANITLNANGVDFAMRIDSDTDVDGSPEPMWPLDTLIGVVGDYNGFQVFPRTVADLKYVLIVDNDLMLDFDLESDKAAWGVYDGATGYTTVAWDTTGGVDGGGAMVFGDGGYAYYIKRPLGATPGTWFTLSVDVKNVGWGTPDTYPLNLSIEGLTAVPLSQNINSLADWKTVNFYGISDAAAGYLVISGSNTSLANAGGEIKVWLDNLMYNDDTVVPDTIPPVVHKVTAWNDSTLMVHWTEPIEPLSAENMANYVVDKGIGSPVMTMAANQKVRLVFANKMKADSLYTITINNVADTSGNLVPTDHKQWFQYHPLVAGTPDLFFSEYVEGSSNNKALEVTNGSAGSIFLGDYRISGTSNGGTDWNSSVFDFPSMELGSGESIVLASNQAAAAVLDVAAFTFAYEDNRIVYYNGDDARGLFFGDEMIDVIGTDVGGDPGTNWPVAGGLGATSEYTLVRKMGIVSGEADWAVSAGTDAESSQWHVLPQDFFAFLGYHPHDIGAPEVLWGNIVDANTIEIYFDDMVGIDTMSVKETGNYVIDGDIGSPTAVTLAPGYSPNGVTAVLTTASMNMNQSYNITISGISNVVGYVLEEESGTDYLDSHVLDDGDIVLNDFESGIGSWQTNLKYSGSTTGLLDGSTITATTEEAFEGSGSAKIKILDDPAKSGWFIRMLNRTDKIAPDGRLQFRVKGNNSGMRVRIVIWDNGSGGDGYEASEWHYISSSPDDWQTVMLDLANDPVEGWITGNGAINSTDEVTIESIQMQSMQDITDTLYMDLLVERGKFTGLEEMALPERFALHQNYPNPFNPTTTISYDLPQQSQVRLIVYNAIGQRVADLVNKDQAPGYYSLQWNGRDNFGNTVSSGVYFYRIITPGFTASHKMLFVK